jgi:hypothetical protein
VLDGALDVFGRSCGGDVAADDEQVDGADLFHRLWERGEVVVDVGEVGDFHAT